MKTIEVSDEMYDNLIELATEMTTQDMRATRMPHMFQIRTKREVAAYEGCGETKWINEEGDEIEENEEGAREIQVTTEEMFQNTFFTAKACQEHIDRNHYHYNEPDVYLNCAWRNPEMEMVSEFLCNLIEGTNHR